MYFFNDFIIALRLAFRAKFALMASGLLLVVLVATLLSAYFGGRQPATVALDVGFSTIRLLLPLMIVLLVQELLSREFDKRYYLNSLTYPRSRSRLLLGRFAAILVLILVQLLVLGLLLIGLVKFISGFYPQAASIGLGQPFAIVIFFIALDLLVLITLATLLSVVASTPSFVLIGTFGFMLVARSYGAILELLGKNTGLVNGADGYRASLGVLGYFMPDLGALDVRMLALYGKVEFLPADWIWLLLSCLGYAGSLLALALWALQHKRFV
ncbi:MULTISPECIES: ABC transporter permease [unclassified Pseudomonas]|uniref:ABC transporter permease n=1 Tax=unclassified Pseudomonas TaxID=196821 RepID=UPI0024495240|nr:MULTISPECIES: ABC transporter permease [unclassified Pseudomonas]MDG9922169.1 ABC transporter permease [Pseudomonas sp. GD04045]MDH0033738.1 ABC transporter permease [Pseudomonas sp. GD04019]